MDKFTNKFTNRITMSQNKINKNWNEFIFNLDGLILNNFILKLALTNFRNIVMRKLSEETKVGLIFRVKFKDGSIRSYSYLQTFNNTLFNELLEALEGFLEVKNDDYKDEIIVDLNFSYFIFSSKINPKNKIKKGSTEEQSFIKTINKKDSNKYFKFSG